MEINETMRTVMLTEKEKLAAVKVIQKMRQLYRQGKGWIKRAEEREGPDNQPQFCLIGAAKEARDLVKSPIGMEIADLAIAKVIKKGEQDDFIVDGEIDISNIEDVMVDFNDKKSRVFKQIDETLTEAEELIRMGSITY